LLKSRIGVTEILIIEKEEEKRRKAEAEAEREKMRAKLDEQARIQLAKEVEIEARLSGNNVPVTNVWKPGSGSWRSKHTNQTGNALATASPSLKKPTPLAFESAKRGPALPPDSRSTARGFPNGKDRTSRVKDCN
jgi:hypothetical protein